MVKRIGLLVLVVALGLAVGAGAAQGTGKLSGVARDAQDQPLPSAKLQVRNVDTGQLVATGRSSANGAFEFSGLNPGNYVVEIVDEAGRIIGISPSTALATGGAITGLIVTVSASGTAAAAAAAGGLGAFFTSTAGILLLVGIGAGTAAAIIALNDDASPSR